MARPVSFNNKNKGATLLELLIALLILLVVSLALTQGALLGIATNVQNAMRDEAVNVADMRMNQLKTLPFTDVVIDPGLTATPVTPPPNCVPEAGITRSLRGFTATYTPCRAISDINADSKQIAITVTWTYKGKTYKQGTMSIMRKIITQ
jgi:type II secretory pathway pseudopilin PulG